MSKRLERWMDVNELVEEHIENYTVPQYGDYPDDQMTGFTQDEIIMNMKRYLNRAKSSQRGSEDALRDCLKLAHYAGELYLMKEEEM